MIKFEDDCCDCSVPSYPCLGDKCRYKNVRHLYCDKCKADVSELYEVSEKQYCKLCAVKVLINFDNVLQFIQSSPETVEDFILESGGRKIE